jgi:hypothetical protein
VRVNAIGPGPTIRGHRQSEPLRPPARGHRAEPRLGPRGHLAALDYLLAPRR